VDLIRFFDCIFRQEKIQTKEFSLKNRWLCSRKMLTNDCCGSKRKISLDESEASAEGKNRGGAKTACCASVREEGKLLDEEEGLAVSSTPRSPWYTQTLHNCYVFVQREQR
jgi:hypothetical protein